MSPAEQTTARHRPWQGGPDWVSAQTRAHVDALTLDAPSVIGTGERTKVGASVTQGSRTVPVAFPLSADWTGSPNLHIGGPDGARGRHVAALDPVTGTLSALRPGTVTLAVSVNGTTRQVRIEVAAGAVLAPAA